MSHAASGVEMQERDQAAPKAFLAVEDLRIHFRTDDGVVRAVDGLTFTVERDQTLGIVGESGSGKSVTSLGILGLHRRGSAQVSGEVWLDGVELVGADPARVRASRRNQMAIITHGLGVVAELADDILVMYGGKCVEYGSAQTIFRRPEHPYAWGLLSSVPRVDRDVRDRLVPIKGSPPSLINLPSGCSFHPRC